MRHVFTAFAIVALSALVACSGSDAGTTPEASDSSSSTTSTTASDDQSAQTAAILDVSPPAEYYTLNVVTPVVAPGTTVTVYADGDPSTALHLIGPAGVEFDTKWSANRATVELPASQAEGLYILQVDGQPSFATLRVVAETSLHLATERSYIGSQEGVTLRASATLPVGDLIAWLVVETDEVGFGGAPVEHYYSPTASGTLAALAPKPLAEFLDRPLYLPTGVVGSMRIMAGTAETLLADLGVDEYESNLVSIGNCDAGSMVTGTTSGRALVRAVWADLGVRSAAIEADGDFQLEAGAGSVLVSVLPLDGNDGAPIPDYFAVNAPCEDSVSIGTVMAGPPTNAASSLVTAPAPSVGGTAGQVCRTVFVSRITINGGTDDWGPHVASELARLLPHASVISQSDADQITAFEALRQALEVGDDALIEQLGRVIGTSDFVVTGSVRDTLGEASVALFAFQKRDTDVGAQGSWSGGTIEAALLDQALPELAEDMRDSAICGAVTPEQSSIESDEQVDLIYELTDLAGKRVDGATVSITSPTLGTLDPDGGPTDNGVFETTFTPEVGASGSQGLEFTSEWNGQSGTVRTREYEARTRILIDADWRIHMEATEVQGDLGNDGYTRFVWDGEFTVDADGVIEGSGTGTVEMGGRCIVDGGAVEGPFKIPGTFTYNISGERTYSNDPDFVLGFTGTSFAIGQIEPAPVSGPCQLLGALGQGLGGEVMRVIAHNPQFMPLESEGALILPVAAGTTSFETWSGPPFTVTLEGVAYD